MAQPAIYDREERRATKLRQVRKLLAKADGTNNPAEADTFRAAADRLMTEYAISEFDVKQGGEQQRAEPISRPFNTEWYYRHQFGQGALWMLFCRTAYHCRCTVVAWKASTDPRTGDDLTPVVGMPGDLDYFDMLFTHLWQQMSKGLEPHPDPDKQMIENLVTMKEAGMKWERIGELLHGIGQLDEPYTRKTGVRFTKLYTDYCEKHNRPRLRVSPKTYQFSFAEGFVRGVQEQFVIQRKLSEPAPADKSLDQLLRGEAGSTALVMRDIRQAANAKAREIFGDPPKRRGSGRRSSRMVDTGAFVNGQVAGVRANTSGASPRQGVGAGRKELNR